MKIISISPTYKTNTLKQRNVTDPFPLILGKFHEILQTCVLLSLAIYLMAFSHIVKYRRMSIMEIATSSFGHANSGVNRV